MRPEHTHKINNNKKKEGGLKPVVCCKSHIGTHFGLERWAEGPNNPGSAESRCAEAFPRETTVPHHLKATLLGVQAQV